MNYNQNERAKALGTTFLKYGFSALREYSAKKELFLKKFLNNEALLTDTNLTTTIQSTLSELYILQQRATLFIQYGMQVYQSTTDLADKTLAEYLQSRLVAISIAFIPDSFIKDTGGYIKLVNEQNEKLNDLLDDAVTLQQVQSTYYKMWEQLLDVNNYDSFYSEAVQSNNIDLLKASGYTFDEVIEDTTPPTVSFQIGTYNSYDTITSTDPIDVTFIWSEDVTGFYTDDVVVTGATKVVFTKVSDSVYNLQIEPNDNFAGELSVQVFKYQVQDNAYNSGVGTLTGSVNVNTIVQESEAKVVIDSTTGLMWQNNIHITKIKLPLVTYTNFQEGKYFDTSGNSAVTYCTELSLAEYSDWRLPTKDELYSVIKENSVILQSEYAEYFWSSTTNYDYGQGYAWVVRFDGSISAHRKDYSNNIRCVRNNSSSAGAGTGTISGGRVDGF